MLWILLTLQIMMDSISAYIIKKQDGEVWSMMANRRNAYSCRAVLAGLCGMVPLAAGAAPEYGTENLSLEMMNLRRQVEAQSIALRAFADRLTELERAQRSVSDSEQGRFIRTVDQPRATAADNQQREGDGEEVVREAKPSRSVETVLQEEHALFDRRLTVEAGLTYAHFDRRQLALNGFLALDAIFLGNISVDEVDADVLTFDVTGRYGLTDRLQLDLNAPFLYRHTNYISGGAGGAAAELVEEDVSMDFTLGDISAGAYYQVFKETPTRPDVVWNVRLKAPTGTDPYGVDVVEVSGSEGNLTVPVELPSGNGLWALSTGLSFVKTVDPALLFANVSYFHNFEGDFDDLDSDPDTVTPGSIKLGDSFQYGLGLAFALNERLSLSMSYSQRFTGKSSRRYQGESWEDIIGSDANAATLNLGTTYSMDEQLSVVSNLGVGLTPDASDFTFSLKFPYTF